MIQFVQNNFLDNKKPAEAGFLVIHNTKRSTK
jgi:hypothetical protein